MEIIKKKVSMQDIANKLGISKNAVSLAINNKPGVSPETKELVIAMANRMGYIGKNDIKSNKILLLIPAYLQNDSYFYNEIYWTIEERARQMSHLTIMASVTEEMQRTGELPSVTHEMSFIGIIVVGILSESYIHLLKRTNPNTISVDHYYPNLSITSVVTANIDGAFQLTEHAIQSGHEKIGFCGPIKSTASIYERWCGYQRAMLEFSLDFNAAYNIVGSSPLDTLYSDSSELFEKLLEIRELPTAFVCGGDRIAVALIEALNKLNLKVPEDVSVIGFDDIAIASIVTPNLTTYKVNRKGLAKEAVNTVIRFRPHNPPKKIELFGEIVVRDSVIHPTNKVLIN